MRESQMFARIDRGFVDAGGENRDRIPADVQRGLMRVTVNPERESRHDPKAGRRKIAHDMRRRASAI